MKNEFENIDQIGKQASELFAPEAPSMNFSKIRKRIVWYSVFNLALLGGIRQYWYLFLLPLLLSLLFFVLPYQDNSSVCESGVSRENSKSFSENIDVLNKELTFNADNKSFVNNQSQNFNISSFRKKNSIGFNENLPISPNEQSNSVTPQYENEKAAIHKAKEYLTEDFYVEKNTVERVNLPYLKKHSATSEPVLDMISNQNQSYTRQLEWSLLASTNVSFLNNVSGDFAAGKKYNNQPTIQGFSLQTSCSYRNFFASGGLEYNQSIISLESPLQLFNPSVQNQLIENHQWTIDTNSFWHLTWVQDSTYHIGDSIWQTIVDSTLVTSYDTLKTLTYDTIKNSKASFSVSMFLMPINIGYKIPMGLYEVGFSGGFSLGYLQKVKGNYFADSEHNEPMVDASKLFSSKFWVYSWQFNMFVNRNLGNHWSIGVMPYYRSNLKVIRKMENDKANNISNIGININLIYHFL